MRSISPVSLLFLVLLLVLTPPTLAQQASSSSSSRKKGRSRHHPFAKRRRLQSGTDPTTPTTTTTTTSTPPLPSTTSEVKPPVVGTTPGNALAVEPLPSSPPLPTEEVVEEAEGEAVKEEEEKENVATTTTTTTTTTPTTPTVPFVPPITAPLFQKLVTVINPAIKDGVETVQEGTMAMTTTTISVDSLEPPKEVTENVLNVEEAYKQCLGARLGTEAVANLTLNTLVPDAHRRLRALAPDDPSCSIMRPFMLIINQTLGLEALGGLISQPLLDRNIRNFRAMGAGRTGCFIVPLNRCSAEELLTDARIAVAVPVDKAMKKPLHFEDKLNTTIAAIQDASTQAAQEVAAQVNKVLDTASAANLSSISAFPGFSFPGSESDFATIPDVKDIINNAMGGQLKQPEHKMPTSISMHVTLVDATGIEESIAAWKEELMANGVDVEDVSFSVTDEVPTLAAEMAEAAEDAVASAGEAGAAVAAEAVKESEALLETLAAAAVPSSTTSTTTSTPHTSTRYLIVKNVPPTAAAAVSEFLTTRPVVDFVELTPRLLFLTRWARGVTQSGDWQSMPLTTSLGLDGKGQIIGMADTGIDPKVCFMSDTNPVPYNTVSVNHRKLVTYITFADGKENTERQGDTTSIGHGSHVASTLVGNSRASTASAAYNGMAPNSKVAFFDIAKYDGAGNIQLYPPGDLNSDLFEKLYNAGARVMSMSWGSPDSNCYSSYAVMVDEFMYNYPDALVIFAAGNSGIQGDYSVVTPSTAKSCVTVGASYNVQQTSFGLENNINYVAFFSSAGPTADGRLKPDLVAPGYYITAAKAMSSCDTIQSRGTSMATPVVAGNAALIRQWFMKGLYQNKPFVPNGALLKAMLVHSAQRMTAYEDPNGALRAVTYPDNHQGYGRIQLDQVVDTKGRFTLLAYGTEDPNDSRYRIFNKQGDTHEYKLRVTNSTKGQPRALKVTLAWTDRPGSATSCQKTRQSVLTNDLDLVVRGPKGQVIYPISTAGAGADRFNPLEQIVINSPVAGGNYTISVLAHNLVTVQNYALVISGQFSGFAYNETASELGPVEDVWDTFVAALGGSTGGAVMLVLFLVVMGLGCIGLCFRPPQQLSSRIGGAGGHRGRGGGGMVTLHNEEIRSRSPLPQEEDDKGYKDAARALAYVVPPPKPARVEDDANRVELFGLT